MEMRREPPSPSLFPLAGNTLCSCTLSLQPNYVRCCETLADSFFCWRARTLAQCVKPAWQFRWWKCFPLVALMETRGRRKKRAIKYRSELIFWMDVADARWEIESYVYYSASFDIKVCFYYFVVRALNDHSTWLIRDAQVLRRRRSISLALQDFHSTLTRGGAWKIMVSIKAKDTTVLEFHVVEND